MHRKMRVMKKVFQLLVVSVLFPVVFLYGCVETVPAGGEAVKTENAEENSADNEQLQKEELERLTRGDVHVDEEKLADYASGFALVYEDEAGQMIYSLEMPQIPESDDAYLYLFALECYEDETKLIGEPAASGLKGTNCEISFIYEKEYLFEQFIPALLIDGKYVSVGSGIYLSNPDALAYNKAEYPELNSKKGLLLDPTMLGTEELTDLGVKHAIYNIPLSIIMGETTDEAYPTIVYTYQGEDYYFNGRQLMGMTDCLLI